MKKNVIIVVLLLLVIGLGGYIGYDYLTYKKENKKVTEKTNNNAIQELKKIDNTKELVYYDTEKLGKVLFLAGDDYGGCFNEKEELENWLTENKNNSEINLVDNIGMSSLIDNDNNIMLKYPIINIDNETVNKINEEIKKYIDEGKQRIIEGEKRYAAKYVINNQIKYSSGFNWNEVEIYESQKFISIVFKNYYYIACAGSELSIEKVRYINKETGLEASEYDILENYNYKNIDDLKSKIKYNEDDVDISSFYSLYIDNNEKLHVLGNLDYIIENNEIK